MVWEEHRDAVQMCRDGISKSKAQMELILARDPKNNRREFYRYIAQKKKDQGECKVSVPLLMDERGEHVTTDMENTEYSTTS